MRRAILAAALCASLGACATPGGLNTSHAAIERAEIAAELLYQEAAPNLTEAQKLKAWADLQQVRKAYDAGQAIDGLVLALKADLPQGGK